MGAGRLWLAKLCAVAAAGAVHAAESTRAFEPVAPAPKGERRIALVIGNGGYKSAPLRNPVNDARAIQKALTATGFRVVVVEDGSQSGMRRAIREFGDELARGGVGLFYYAGHGMQVRGRNYLIPVNADIQREDEVEDQAVDANFVLSKMDTAKNALNIMILDACRNNPFARAFRSSAQGLAQMDAPSGTLIAFATAPGSVASDGEGENGLFTTHLLAAIRQPGLPVEQLFKQVRIGVTKATGDRQVPWESSSLRGDFYFLPPDAGAGAARQQAAIDKAVTDALKQSEERAARERAALEQRSAQDRAEMQKRMEQMIQEALAKQRAQLEAEGKSQRPVAASGAPATTTPVVAPVAAPIPSAVAAKPAEAPIKPAPAPPPAVVVETVASIAPVQAPAVPPPSTGAVWQYLGFDSNRRDRTFGYEVEVTGRSAAGVLETTRDLTGTAVQWVHTTEPTVVGLAEGWTMFSPLALGEPLKPGQSWRDLALERVESCGRGTTSCTASARLAGKERVNVKAGTFEALKVIVEIVMRQGSHSGVATRTLTFWYSDELRRVVRATSVFHGAGPWVVAPNSELELTAYRLENRPAIGTLHQGFARVAAGERAPVSAR